MAIDEYYNNDKNLHNNHDNTNSNKTENKINGKA